MKTFNTEVIRTDENSKKIGWLFTIRDGNCDDTIQMVLDRREIFDLYEASRKAFNEQNLSA